MKRNILISGIVGGLLIAVLRWAEYHFLVIDHSVEMYAALIAGCVRRNGDLAGRPTHPFLQVNNGFGATTTRSWADARSDSTKPVPARHGKTRWSRRHPARYGILDRVAEALSNREIAQTLFVSENTVNAHCSTAFDKLGARRRTEAVLLGKKLGLLP